MKADENKKCAFCDKQKNTVAGRFLVVWPNGKAICNECGKTLKKDKDASINPLIA